MKAPIVVKEEEGTTIMVEEGTTRYQQGNHHPSQFPSSKESMIVYLEWEQKIDQIFNILVISNQEQVDLVVLEFEEYSMTWWHQLCMENLDQWSPMTSWMDIKRLMHARFVPSYYKRKTLLKLQRI